MKIADAATYERIRIKQEREHAKSVGRWIIYPFYNERGEKVFEKVRIPLGGGDKTFRYRHWAPVEPHGYAWDYHKPPGADALLYRLPELLRAKASGADIWWTEGEKDAGKLEEFLEGDDCAVSHHQAAGNSTPEQAEWFRGHTGLVILVMDLDEDQESGANPGAFCVIQRFDQLRAVGIKQSQICVAAPAVGKDVHDHLAAGHSLDELVWVTDLRPLREKHKRGNGFRAAYMGLDKETIELGEMLAKGWHPKVEPRHAW